MNYTFQEVSSHWLIFVLAAIGILTVLAFTVISLRKSWSRALEIGMPKEKLMSVVKATVSYSALPSIAIVVGMFSVSTMLGIAWSWWRLSVVGAVAYEIMAADMALSAVGVDLASATGAEFVLVMFVMTIGIMGGIVCTPFISKKIHLGTMQMKDKDPRWGPLSTSIFMPALLVVFVVPMLFDGGVKLLTLLTSCVITLVLNQVVKATGAGWLRNFTLALALLGAMASSVLWTNLLG